MRIELCHRVKENARRVVTSASVENQALNAPLLYGSRRRLTSLAGSNCWSPYHEYYAEYAPPILHEEAGSNKISNVADCEAMSDPAGLMPTPAHSPLLMNAFLKALDPSAERFTFQLFRDPKHRKDENTPPGLRRLIHHCTIDEAVALARQWNTPEHAYGSS